MESPERRRRHHHQQPNLSFITDSLLSLFSLSSTSFHRDVDDTKEKTFNSDTRAAPSTAADGSSMFLTKAVLGFVGAGYVCLVLTTVMVVSVVVGVGFVSLWVEEPIYIEEKLYFDYTDVHPSAVLGFGIEERDGLVEIVPGGHFCKVGLVFVMPESDYNREIGMFQVVAESLSSNGEVITASSHPCMLRFQSPPIRAIRTLLMTAPLLLGITTEIQTINIPILKYKEHHHPRTQTFRISLLPRAGTSFLPQLYEAKVIISSELPWMKRLIRNWKWTFYVWTSLYIYLMLLLVLVCFFRSIMFPTMTTVSDDQTSAVSDGLDEEPPRLVGASDVPSLEDLERWRQSIRKRKAMFLGGGFVETSARSDATSMSVTRDEDTSVTTEEVGDSESVCE